MFILYRILDWLLPAWNIFKGTTTQLSFYALFHKIRISRKRITASLKLVFYHINVSHFCFYMKLQSSADLYWGIWWVLHSKGEVAVYLVMNLDANSWVFILTVNSKANRKETYHGATWKGTAASRTQQSCSYPQPFGKPVPRAAETEQGYQGQWIRLYSLRIIVQLSLHSGRNCSFTHVLFYTGYNKHDFYSSA